MPSNRFKNQPFQPLQLVFSKIPLSKNLHHIETSRNIILNLKILFIWFCCIICVQSINKMNLLWIMFIFYRNEPSDFTCKFLDWCLHDTSFSSNKFLSKLYNLRHLIFRNKVDILVEKLFKQEDCTYRKLKIYHRSITNF